MSDPLTGARAQQRIRLFGAILWPSFLTAAVATVVFFASIDPETLRAQTAPGWEISRRTGYTLGFFMFWAVCAASSYLSLMLFRTAPKAPPQASDPES